MNESEFQKHLKIDTYQVLFMGSKMPFPLNMFIHTWVVTIENGVAHRYDVWAHKNRCESSRGYLHVDLYKPWVGVRKIFSKNADPDSPRSSSFLLYTLQGGEGSTAQAMVKYIAQSLDMYPYTGTYRYFPGPNSNTFTSWVLRNFLHVSFRLPWRAVGKGYCK